MVTPYGDLMGEILAITADMHWTKAEAMALPKRDRKTIYKVIMKHASSK